jgi:hypothetical protein
VSSNAPEVAAREIAQNVVDEVGRIPEVQHATNNEPWYQSRVTWGTIISMASGVAGGLGFALAPEDIDQLVSILSAGGVLVGGLITFIGRWASRKPIGT